MQLTLVQHLPMKAQPERVDDINESGRWGRCHDELVKYRNPTFCGVNSPVGPGQGSEQE
jgi:hypothetical protein